MNGLRERTKSEGEIVVYIFRKGKIRQIIIIRLNSTIFVTTNF